MFSLGDIRVGRGEEWGLRRGVHVAVLFCTEEALKRNWCCGCGREAVFGAAEAMVMMSMCFLHLVLFLSVVLMTMVAMVFSFYCMLL